MAGQLERQPEVEHIKVEVKFVWQISYPSADGVSQGNYFLPISHKLAKISAHSVLPVLRLLGQSF